MAHYIIHSVDYPPLAELGLRGGRGGVSTTAQRLHGGGGSFDQLHAMDYFVYAYLQQAKDASARKALAEMEEIARLDEDQFAAAYAAPEALKEYQAVLKTAPCRFNATAGAAKAADKAGDQTKARAYAMQLREIAKHAETSWPELEWARVYLGSK